MGIMVIKRRRIRGAIYQPWTKIPYIKTNMDSLKEINRIFELQSEPTNIVKVKKFLIQR